MRGKCLYQLGTVQLLVCALRLGRRGAGCACTAALGPRRREAAFASARARAAAPRMQGFFDGIKDIALQYADQRVARASHIQLRAGDDSGILLAQWKEEIGDDEEKFAARARESSTCRSAPKGGDLGFLTVRAPRTLRNSPPRLPLLLPPPPPSRSPPGSPSAAAQFSPPRAMPRRA